jgi:large subunit ribosomal protein L15
MSMIHDITSSVPRHKRRRRKGRGESSGHGKTSGRGTKGSGARVGTYIKLTYEGGQTPLHRRIPTRGFSNAEFRTAYHIINVADLDVFEDGATVDAAALVEKRLIPDTKFPVKILGDGELKHRLTIQADWYTKSAHQKILAAGGSANNAKGAPFEFPKPKKIFVKREPVKKAPAVEAPAAEKPVEKKSEKPAE